ncbi:MAG: DUF1579 family protein [Candidatus Omnitrophota bacterium]|jgi:uncharacterized protein YndB with AHSA1/START domain
MFKKKQEKLDSRKMMEIYKELGTPGEAHKLLAKLEGSWSARTRNWIEPGKPAIESMGSSERKMILGGRYLQEEYTGDIMGNPFRGISLTGYDNHRKKYFMIWVDSMSTRFFVFEGNIASDGKTITLSGLADDPVRGKVNWRSVIRVINDNTQAFEMSGTDKHGIEEKMEITYNRKTEEEILITRIFDAPAEVLFKEWTDPEHLKRWWGPRGFTLPVYTADLKPGGVTHYCMRSPEGKDYCGIGTFREITSPERIVYNDAFADEKGNPVSAAYYGLNTGWPMETKVSVTFEEQEGGKTKLTLRHTAPGAPASELKLCREGWSESLDKLAEELARSCVELGIC